MTPVQHYGTHDCTFVYLFSLLFITGLEGCVSFKFLRLSIGTAVQGVNCELMMETSGHGAMRSNHYLDDGSHLALTAVVAFVRSRLESGGMHDRHNSMLQAKQSAGIAALLYHNTVHEVCTQTSAVVLIKCE